MPLLRPDRIPLQTSLVAVVLLVIVGLAVSRLSATSWLDLRLLDVKFRIDRALFSQPAHDGILIVGVDEGTLGAIAEPAALWHRAYGRAFVALAAARPRAVGLDVILPDRSFDFLSPGADQALITGLLSLRRATILAVGITSTDTGELRTIYPPMLAAAGENAYGLALWRFDIDGRIRRFDERLGAHGEVVPTLVGRLAARLAGADNAAPVPGIIQYAIGDGFDYVPLQQVLDWAERGDTSALAHAFSGKIVFIGSVLPFEDRFHQPVMLARWEAREYAPGVLIHAQALRSLLAGAMVRDAPPWSEFALIVLAAALWFVPTWRLRVPALVVLLATAFGLSLLLLNAGIELPLSAAAIVAIVATALRSALEAWQVRRDRARITLLFGGYVSPAVRDALLAGQLDADASRRRELCFLFADIRNFTAYSETAPPERALEMLNRYYTAMTPLLHAHGGTIDNFRGDGLMVMFGAPNRLPNPAASGLASGRAMFDRLPALNAEFAAEHMPALEIGVTLAYGQAVVGNVGWTQRYNYTAVGDAVNVAARLQDVAKALGYPLIATAAVVERAASEHAADLVALGEQAVRGRRPEEVFGWKPSTQRE